jgi:hypothetical protein
MSEFSAQLGMAADAPWNVRSQWGQLQPGTAVNKVALYPRVEIAKP